MFVFLGGGAYFRGAAYNRREFYVLKKISFTTLNGLDRDSEQNNIKPTLHRVTFILERQDVGEKNPFPMSNPIPLRQP